MGVLRFLAILFNVAVVTFLVYRMLQVRRQPMERSKKIAVMLGGIVLLLVPFGVFLNFFLPTIQYFLIYPVAIALYLYMIREI